MTDYDSYIICTAPRSGSTLLCGLLAATGQSGKPDSHFHTPSRTRWMEVYGVRREDFASDSDALAAAVSAARTVGTGDTGVFGLRLQRGSFAYFIQQLSALHPDLPTDVARIEAAFGRTLFIHLTRPDKVDQAISRVKATQSGLWHRAAGGSELERLSPEQALTYDRTAIAEAVTELTAFDQAWASWFAQEDLRPLTVTYEALSDDPANALAMILNALGADPTLAAKASPTVAKLADATSLEWARRFRAETLG